MWKLRNFTHTFEKIRENSILCDLELNAMISRNFSEKKKIVRVNFCNFHSVRAILLRLFKPHLMRLLSNKSKGLSTVWKFKNFSTTQILREIIFDDLNLKIASLTIFKGS